MRHETKISAFIDEKNEEEENEKKQDLKVQEINKENENEKLNSDGGISNNNKSEIKADINENDDFNENDFNMLDDENGKLNIF